MEEFWKPLTLVLCCFEYSNYLQITCRLNYFELYSLWLNYQMLTQLQRKVEWSGVSRHAFATWTAIFVLN